MYTSEIIREGSISQEWEISTPGMGNDIFKWYRLILRYFDMYRCYGQGCVGHSTYGLELTGMILHS